MSLPPGPALPAFVQSLQWLAKPVSVMESCAARYGDVFTLNWLGTGRIVFISSPPLIKEIFTGDPSVLHGGEGNSIVEPLLGKMSLFVLDGDAHLRQRRLLLPPFHGERMQAYAAVMRDVADRAIDRWARGDSFSLHHEMQEVTLEVIIRTVFGVGMGPRDSSLGPMLDVLHPLLDFVGSRATDLFTLLPTEEAQRFVRVDLGPWSPWGRFLRLRRALDDAIYAEVNRRRETGVRDASVMSLLLDARDEAGNPMSDVELRDELVTLLIAGHETTAAGLAWAFDNILANPDVTARVEKELAEVAPDGELTVEQLGRLAYVDAVAKEALRLRPILQIVARRQKAPLRVGTWDLPEGTVVAPCIYLTHRRPDLYPDPERFDPTRFLDAKASPYAFLPFGGGIRKCIGAAFALYQMKVVIAAVMSRAKLRLVAPSERAARRTVTLVPARRTKVVLESVRERRRRAREAVAGAAR
jgi:cytochrome P450